MHRRSVTLSFVFLAACYGDGSFVGTDADGVSDSGDDASDDTAGGRPDPERDTGRGDSSLADTDDDGSSAGDDTGEPAQPTPVCTPTCTIDADCPTDQYTCNGGLCVFGGCRSDAECAELGAYVCAEQPGSVPVCVQACNTPSDCGTGPESSPYSADNYTCAGGACIYAGCSADAECATLGDYACFDFGTTSLCATPCDQAADCVLPGAGVAYDLDNYACDAGRCTYTGCQNAAECATLGDYTCAVVELSGN